MAVIFADRIKETTTTTGTGDITLAGAVQGFRTFASAMTTGDTCYYCIDDEAGNWEIGLGTFQSDGKLDRTTVHTSSTGGTAVNFAAGTKNVFITVSAACWNDWVSGLSSMASLPDNLVFEYEVTGSAVTTIPATGLDLNADGGCYEIVFEIVSATATDSYIYLFISNDTTVTNYTSHYIASASTTVSTNSVNLPYFAYTYETGQYGLVIANLSLINSHSVVNAQSFSDNAAYARMTYIYKSTTDTNITRLDFTCATASGIGVGSKVKIFKKEW